MPNLISTNHSVKDKINRLVTVIEYFQSFYNNFLVPIFFLLIFQVYRTNFMSFIKLLQILMRTPPIIIGRLINRYIWKKTEFLSYHINDSITSTTTQILFAHSKLTGIDICMKVWPKRKIGESSPEDPKIQLKIYLMDLHSIKVLRLVSILVLLLSPYKVKEHKKFCEEA